MNPTLSFELALTNLKDGRSVARKGWNGKGMFITLQIPTDTSKMTSPYLFMTVPAGSSTQFPEGVTMKDQMIPWLPSQTDLISEDWFIVTI